MSFPAILEELGDAVARGAPERRAEIVGRLADVFAAGSAGYSGSQIDFFDDAFMRIVAMIELSARAALADRLARDPHAPVMISRALASDDEIAVAAPMLEHSEQLDLDTLVVAASTKSQDHLLAISKRRALDEAVTDVLVERGDKPVMLNVAANPQARFSDDGYKTLVTRSHGDDELTTSVALRSDMPREHLYHLLVRASRDVQIKLEAAHPSMAKTIQEAVAEAATKILDKTSKLSRDYGAARKRVESLLAGGRLDESSLTDFTAANKFEETAAALALLSGVSIEQIDQAMIQDRPEAVLVIAKAIGLSWATVKGILRLRAGECGISPGELEQCLATFSRLNPVVARQVLEFRNRPGRPSRFGRSAA
jgi:uncharacterized protein (DUF2336 family)